MATFGLHWVQTASFFGISLWKYYQYSTLYFYFSGFEAKVAHQAWLSTWRVPIKAKSFFAHSRCNIKEKFLQAFFVYNKNVSSLFIIVYKALLSKVNVAF